MVLKPQDLLVVLKLWVEWEMPWTYQLLAPELGVSLSEAHGALGRAAKAGFLMEAGLAQALNPLALLDAIRGGGLGNASGPFNCLWSG